MKYIFAAFLFVAVVMGYSSFNGFVSKDEEVMQTYAQVQNVLSRQAQIVPNLVKVTERYAKHENSTLVGLSEARNAVAKSNITNIDPREIANNPELQKKLYDSQATMTAALVNFRSTTEAYPELKADKLFSELNAEIVGSQNRVTVERRRNQIAIQDYNNSVRRLPGKFVAMLTGFDPYPYYRAADSEQNAPVVEFKE